MGNRPFDFEFEQPYHIYNRGANKMQLFYEESDYEYFLRKIAIYSEKFPNIEFFSYAILPNHFHFLLVNHDTELPSSNSMFRDKTASRKPTISQFMQKVQQSYALFFSAKHKDKKKHKGLVFEGRFQARVVLDEGYQSHLQNYIEYNPVKHGLVKDPKDWEYSSFNFNTRKESSFEKTFLNDPFDPVFD